MALEIGMRNFVANPHGVFLLKKVKTEKREQGFIEDLINKKDVPQFDRNQLQTREMEFL